MRKPRDYGFRIDDAETFIREAPHYLIERCARDAGRINLFVLWDPNDGEDGFLLTSDNAQELVASWQDHFEEIT